MAILHPVICPIFIGRTSQVALFNRLVAEVSAGNTTSPFQVITITGEAGIGKSRFVYEVTSTAIEHGSTVLEGRCFEQDQTLPYGPLVDLLNAFCLRQPRERLEPALSPLAPALVRIFPEISSYVVKTLPLPMLDPEGEKRRITYLSSPGAISVASGS
jgi:predicted ATPase